MIGSRFGATAVPLHLKVTSRKLHYFYAVCAMKHDFGSRVQQLLCLGSFQMLLYHTTRSYTRRKPLTRKKRHRA